ncbi:MAG: hypothetical protein J6R43_04280, partial [Paludibacteraceae bacterium]|nr:hypothetical protein [Paludibacteraceae bacterium]
MVKISPIKERILSFIDYKGFNKVDFFDKVGISYGNFKGKGLESEIGGSQIAKILTIFSEISPEWLLTGEGEMLKKEAKFVTTTENFDPNKPHDKHL